MLCFKKKNYSNCTKQDIFTMKVKKIEDKICVAIFVSFYFLVYNICENDFDPFQILI